MKAITVEELLEAGVHFGHRGSRWNPKMKPYIFMKGNQIHIIDLRKTVRGLLIGTRFLKRICAQGGDILFVGTKRQASSIVLAEAKRCGMHYVNTRWLGGTLTNFDVIRKRLRRLEELEQLEEDPRTKLLSKKVQSALTRERAKMKRNLDGIRDMKKLPRAMVVVDPRHEHNAVMEARKCGIPTISVLDTDADPEIVDIQIPANDDAMRSIQVLLSKLTDAVMEGIDVYKSHVGPVSQEGGKAPAGRRAEGAKPSPAPAKPAPAPPAVAASGQAEGPAQPAASAPATPAPDTPAPAAPAPAAPAPAAEGEAEKPAAESAQGGGDSGKPEGEGGTPA